MSGGSHNYEYSSLAMSLDIPSGHYGYIREDNEEYEYVRKTNPMEDIELSELMYDVSCLLHSLEWYQSADTDEECYRKDVDTFKKKWFDTPRTDRLEKMIEAIFEKSKQEALMLIGKESDTDG